MIKVEPIIHESVNSESEELRQQHPAQTLIDRILKKLSGLELPAKEYFERYLRHCGVFDETFEILPWL